MYIHKKRCFFSYQITVWNTFLMLIYVKLSWRVFGMQQKWCLMMTPPSMRHERGTREWMYSLREGIRVVFYYQQKRFLQIFKIYDVSNKWNGRDMTVQIPWSTSFLKSDHKVIDTYCVFFLCPFSCKSSRQWNNERSTPLIPRSL